MTERVTAYNFVKKSTNVKTGKIPVTMTTAETCPNACPFKGNGCYAQQGPLAFVWAQLGKPPTHKKAPKSLDLGTLCERIAALPEGQLWRHNQAGDLPGENNAIDADTLAKLVEANAGKRGFTYTHKPLTAENSEAIRQANAAGFTINLSGNNLVHADQLADAAIAPVVTVLPSDVHGNVKLQTPAGRTVAVCPATYRDDVTCASCGLCQRQDRKVIVGFPAHGAATAKANAIAKF